MVVKGTYFQNDKDHPLVYGDINLINPPRRRLRGEEEKEGILAETVIAGFCGTDHELMRMGSEGLRCLGGLAQGPSLCGRRQDRSRGLLVRRYHDLDAPDAGSGQVPLRNRWWRCL